MLSTVGCLIEMMTMMKFRRIVHNFKYRKTRYKELNGYILNLSVLALVYNATSYILWSQSALSMLCLHFKCIGITCSLAFTVVV